MVFGLGKKIAGFFSGGQKIDEEYLVDLEDTLLMGDVSYELVEEIVGSLRKKKFGDELSGDEVKNLLKDSLKKTMDFKSDDLLEKVKNHNDGSPFVILMNGVNGAGKTTTLGKFLNLMKGEGLKVAVVAGDTFRAAATQQLQVFTDKFGAKLYSREGGDPAGLVYDAFNQAKAEGFDVLIVDTAGRLQNREELMAELQKIVRSLKKLSENAPHKSYLVVDGTTGQNGILQAEKFQQSGAIDSLILTKMDSSAKGGIALSIVKKFNLPIDFLCFGEGMGDIEKFDVDAYLDELLG